MSSSINRNAQQNDLPVKSNGYHAAACYSWEQTFHKHEGDGCSVITFPPRVINECLPKDQKTITLTDEENSKSYECDIESINGDPNDKFIAKGWFKCCEDMGLQEGDELRFSMENPPKSLYVYRAVWY